mmetsp:Transcript_7702/g.47661  ORF Transcript_7702/g.47661 Transcript_7702/m.47661 type:complete len:95 (+) Transcript_7702:2310-2594(+)
MTCFPSKYCRKFTAISEPDACSLQVHNMFIQCDTGSNLTYADLYIPGLHSKASVSIHISVAAYSMHLFSSQLWEPGQSSSFRQDTQRVGVESKQ